MSGGERRLLGRWGEALAAAELRRRGYQVIEAGWHCRFGEIDLIATNDKYICFIEVKLRASDRFAQAREFVDRRKRQRILLTAQVYLSARPFELQPRFDVVEIYAPEGIQTRRPRIELIENAFDAAR